MSKPLSRHEALQRLAKAAREGGENATVGSATARPLSADPTERFVEVEWLGERSPLDSPVVAYKLAREGRPDGFTAHQAAVIRAAARLRIGRYKNHNRAMGPESGLSQTYVWGPKARTYVRRMSYRDAEKLKATNSGHEFRILGQEPDAGPLKLPVEGVRLVGAKEFSRIEAVASLAA